jgi:hypothetical protein
MKRTYRLYMVELSWMTSVDLNPGSTGIHSLCAADETIGGQAPLSQNDIERVEP